jgi:hypothetical protein
MSQLFHDLPPAPPLSYTWRGVISSPPVDFADRVSIRIPEMNDNLVFDDIRWMSRDSTMLPQAGDTCLVIFDNDREPWVVAWWPFDNLGE